MAEIPVAALVGLITLIALNTFAWSSITLVLRISFVDAVVVVLVTVVTVWHDLCVAVVIGTIINALGFAWTAATQVKVESEAVSDKKRIFRLKGPLFFGSAMNYKMEVDPHKVEEDEVVLDFNESKILDISAIQAIIEARENLKGSGSCCAVCPLRPSRTCRRTCRSRPRGRGRRSAPAQRTFLAAGTFWFQVGGHEA